MIIIIWWFALWNALKYWFTRKTLFLINRRFLNTHSFCEMFFNCSRGVPFSWIRWRVGQFMASEFWCWMFCDSRSLCLVTMQELYGLVSDTWRIPCFVSVIKSRRSQSHCSSYGMCLTKQVHSAEPPSCNLWVSAV